MTKYLLLLMCSVNIIYADSTMYELLVTSHPDKIAVKEIKQIPMSGFDSSGHTITLYQTVTTEKFFDLYEAFDLGVRYHNSTVVLEALAKLERLHKMIDVSDAIVVVCQSIKDESTSKNIGYICGGIIAALSIIPWIGPATRPVLGYRPSRFGGELRAFDVEVGTSERVICSTAILGMGALVWWATRSAYRDAVKKFGNVLCVLLTSPACFVSDRKMVHTALLSIEDRLDSATHELVVSYLVGAFLK